MSIRRKQGQAALTKRQRRRSERRIGPLERRRRRGGSLDLPEVESRDMDANFNRAFKGLVKLTPQERWEAPRTPTAASWITRRQRRAAQQKAVAAKVRKPTGYAVKPAAKAA